MSRKTQRVLNTADLTDLRRVTGYWYLATPYSKYPQGHEAAFREASRIAAWFLKNHVPVFCPIAHSHPLTEHGDLPGTDHEFWMWADSPLMASACGLIVCKMDGWDESAGIAEEIRRFTAGGKPIVYMEYEFVCGKPD